MPASGAYAAAISGDADADADTDADAADSGAGQGAARRLERAAAAASPRRRAWRLRKHAARAARGLQRALKWAAWWRASAVRAYATDYETLLLDMPKAARTQSMEQLVGHLLQQAVRKNAATVVDVTLLDSGLRRLVLTVTGAAAPSCATCNSPRELSHKAPRKSLHEPPRNSPRTARVALLLNRHITDRNTIQYTVVRNLARHADFMLPAVLFDPSDGKLTVYA